MTSRFSISGFVFCLLSLCFFWGRISTREHKPPKLENQGGAVQIRWQQRPPARASAASQQAKHDDKNLSRRWI